MTPRDRYELEALHPYYRGRWVYLDRVAECLARLSPRSVLELGPGPARYVPGSMAVDCDPDADVDVIADVSRPWDWCVGRSFDVAIALQVLEHVERPRVVVRRMLAHARAAVVSVPVAWTGSDAAHSRPLEYWTGVVGVGRIVESVRVVRPRGRERHIFVLC